MLLKAHVTDVRLSSPQGCLISNDPGADIKNRSSSCCSEFDGACITHTGGAGGTGHVPATRTTTSRDAQPTSPISNSTAQSFAFSIGFHLLFGCGLVQDGEAPLGVLLFGECRASLFCSSVCDRGKISLTAGFVPGDDLPICVGLPNPSDGSAGGEECCRNNGGADQFQLSFGHGTSLKKMWWPRRNVCVAPDTHFGGLVIDVE